MAILEIDVTAEFSLVMGINTRYHPCRFLTRSLDLGNRVSEEAIHRSSKAAESAATSAPGPASGPRLGRQRHRRTTTRTARRETDLSLVGVVPHTVVTMVNGGRITDGGKYPTRYQTPSMDSRHFSVAHAHA